MEDNVDKNKGNVEENSGQSVGLANLTPWKPGQSGNPKGRPAGRKTGLRARLLQELDKQADEDIVKILEAKGIKLDNGDCAEVIAKALTRKSQKGDVAAAKLIAEQTEMDLPKQVKLEHSGRIDHDHQPVSRTLEILEEFNGDGTSGDASEPLSH